MGFQGKEILFSGNNLSEEDFQVGLEHNVLFNLDDISLFGRLLKKKKPSVVSFRINPGIGKSNVHESDLLAGPNAKFGIPWEMAKEAYTQAKEAGIERVGVHMMTGSCVTDPNYFEEITKKLFE